MKISHAVKDNIRTLLYAWRFPGDMFFCYWKLKYWHPTWRLWGTPLIQKHANAKISIGNNWVACSDPRKNSLGVFQKVTIKALSPQSHLSIGNNVGMSGVSICCSLRIEIGNDVLLGSGAVITDTDAHPLHPAERNNAKLIGTRKVIIEDGVFIGARAMILKGVTIGRGSVIGAGAIVTRDVPPLSIAVGNPAQVTGMVRRKGQE